SLATLARGTSSTTRVGNGFAHLEYRAELG
ncbi:MAG: hypothetical protein JWM98_745, partial [Thermoleophilia bacterium]|nr:hypothetical protein [Thermoleophilia bacterium]